MVFKAGESVGASGSFFFFTLDKKFIVKTLRGNEKQVLLKIADDYVDYILNRTDNKSLLARIYGIFTISTTYFVPLDIILMQSTSIVDNSQDILYKFDLKGSKYNRRVNHKVQF